MVEGLSGVMRAAVHQNMFIGYKLGVDKIIVFHIQLADDKAFDW